MGKYRSLDELETEYFQNHPEEIDDYILLIFDEYSHGGELGALLASLRVLCRVHGITQIAEKIGMSRKGLQKALSDNGNPGFASVNAVVQALGYDLIPKKRQPLQG